jgi:hypothetical protein
MFVIVVLFYFSFFFLFFFSLFFFLSLPSLPLPQATQGGAIFTKANVTIKYCTFVNNSAANDDGNDVYANFTSVFFGNTNNMVSDCSLSYPPQLVAGGVCGRGCIDIRIWG